MGRPGMTLIEMMVVLVIVAAMMVAGVVVSSLLSYSDINKAAATFGRTMQHVYGRAAVNGQRYRLVIDLDEDKYWVECSDENPPMTMDEEAGSAARRFTVRDFYDFDSGLDRFGTREAEVESVEAYDPFNINLDAMFDDCSEDLIPLRLASGDDAGSRDADARGIEFDSVLTSHQREPSTEGRVEINFFPDGFVEPAMIWLFKREDDDDDEMPFATIGVEPMTGLVWIETRRLDVPDNFAQVEEDR